MSKILTLVNTSHFPVGVDVAVVAFLQEHRVQVRDVKRWKAAWEATLEGVVPDCTAFAAEWKVDHALREEADGPARVLVSDMESTLVENEFLDDLAELAGVGERVRNITARAMNGELDFAGSLRERLALLAGQPADLLERAWGGLRWMPGARELVAALKARGVPTVIVSGGFKFFTRRVCGLLGAEREEANDLEIRDGRITGRPREPILGRENKERILRETADGLGLPLEQTAALGDGANDLPMLQAAGLGVAFRAKPAVAAASACRIEHSDLRAMLYFMGCAPD